MLKVDPGAVKGGLQAARARRLQGARAGRPDDRHRLAVRPRGHRDERHRLLAGRTITAPNDFPIADAIQTDAAINPGNSGGPLLDGNGRVIGVNSQIKSGSGSNSGVGFAVPVSTVKFVVPQIENGGKVERAYLGVRNGDTAGSLRRGRRRRRRRRPGAEGRPAATATRSPQIDGRRITGSDDVSAAVAARKPGEQAKVTVERGGDRRTLTVDLGTRPETPAGG